MLVQPMNNADFRRTIEILEQYRDSESGMVDAAAKALAASTRPYLYTKSPLQMFGDVDRCVLDMCNKLSEISRTAVVHSTLRDADCTSTGSVRMECKEV